MRPRKQGEQGLWNGKVDVFNASNSPSNISPIVLDRTDMQFTTKCLRNLSSGSEMVLS